MLKSIPPIIIVDGKNKSTEPFLIEYTQQFLATLLYVPDNPDAGVLYLLNGLLNAVEAHDWDQNHDSKFHIYANVLCLLSSYSQEQYLYKIERGGQSNCFLQL